MINILDQTPIALIGGGQFCKKLLSLFYADHFSARKPRVLGVADPDDQAEGIRYASNLGIFTTQNYETLYRKKGLKVLIEITDNPSMSDIIERTKPAKIQLIDQIESRTLWSILQLESEKLKMLAGIQNGEIESDDVGEIITQFADRIEEMIKNRGERYGLIERQLNKNKQELDQIIEGNTIPTFVINQDHIVTHWNRACERLTGFASEKIIGTNDHWKPFRSKKRPIMADLVLDGVKKGDALKYYGKKWHRSILIEGAFEAEEFFPHLGEEGLWLFFTAAPIKAADGQTVGAIETLQDRTAIIKATEETKRQNKLLVATQQEMAQLIQGSTVPTFVINQDHIVTHWNKAIEKLSGYHAEEIVGTNKQWMPFWKTERPSMADVVLDQTSEKTIKKLYEGKWRKSSLIEGAYEAEYFLPNLGTRGKWCWFTAAPIRDTNGKTIGAIETLWDRTEDKQAEEERKRHNRELKTLCSIYQSLGAPLDIEFRINLTMRQIAELLSSDFLCIYLLGNDGLFHLKYKYGVGGNICEKIPVAGKDSMVFEVANNGRLKTFNHLSRHTNSELKMLDDEGLSAAAYTPIFDRNKNVRGVMRSCNRKSRQFSDEEINILELTGNRIGVAIENSNLQEELRDQVYFQSKLIKSSNNGIIATDNTWTIIVFNPEAELLFGRDAADVIGKMDARDLFPKKVIDLLLKNQGTTQQVDEMPWEETSIVVKERIRIPVMFSGTLLYSAGKVMGGVVFFQDLRELKRLEKELINSEQLAAVGQTVAGMAHCIKNILHGFKGGSYLLNVGIDKDNFGKIKNGWGMIQRNIDRTSNLVMDLLTYSREREPEIEQCIPNNIVDDVIDVMAENAAEHEVELVQDLSPDIGEVMLDPKSLHRCLMNLVSNAIDACYFDDSVAKKYRVEIKTALENNSFIRFEIKDNGAGMSEELRSKLFTSVFSTKGAKGTGLGLLVTRKLVEEHDGSVDVSSTPGEGTVFIIRLPLIRDTD